MPNGSLAIKTLIRKNTTTGKSGCLHSLDNHFWGMFQRWEWWDTTRNSDNYVEPLLRTHIHKITINFLNINAHSWTTRCLPCPENTYIPLLLSLFTNKLQRQSVHTTTNVTAWPAVWICLHTSTRPKWKLGTVHTHTTPPLLSTNTTTTARTKQSNNAQFKRTPGVTAPSSSGRWTY